MTPEEHARRKIDRQLDRCGWPVRDRDAMNLSASAGVAVGEFVVPRLSNDEPAEQLLARIRAGQQAPPSADGEARTPRRAQPRNGESARPLLDRIEGASEDVGP